MRPVFTYNLFFPSNNLLSTAFANHSVSFGYIYWSEVHRLLGHMEIVLVLDIKDKVKSSDVTLPTLAHN